LLEVLVEICLRKTYRKNTVIINMIRTIGIRIQMIFVEDEVVGGGCPSL